MTPLAAPRCLLVARATLGVALGLALDLASVALAGTLTGCGGGGGGAQPPDATACPDDRPAACPAPAPSYAGRVAAIVDAACNQCHGPGGSAGKEPLSTHADVARFAQASLDDLVRCTMPPPRSPQMRPEDRAALLAYLVCGAPDN